MVNTEYTSGRWYNWGLCNLHQMIGTPLGTRNTAHLNMSDSDRTPASLSLFLMNNSHVKLPGILWSIKFCRSSVWRYFAARRIRPFASRYKSPKIRNGRGKKATTSKESGLRDSPAVTMTPPRTMLYDIICTWRVRNVVISLRRAAYSASRIGRDSSGVIFPSGENIIWRSQRL